MNTSFAPAAALQTARIRLLLVAIIFMIGLLGVCARLVQVNLRKQNEPTQHGARNSEASLIRGDITDRNGVLLATTLKTASLFADPSMITEKSEVAHQLVQIFDDLDEKDVLEKLSQKRRFVWIKRQITPKQQMAVNHLGNPGLDFQYEVRRFYPQENLASHVVGFTDRDGQGLAGIESYFGKQLTQDDQPIQLSIDTRIQDITREALQKTITHFQAIGGAAAIMDTHTGELISLVSLPDFDPHHPGSQASLDQDSNPTFNRGTLGTYEMGSTFKTFTLALALDQAGVKVSDKFDATNAIKVGRFTISDYHPEHRPLTVAEIFQLSSNIGTVRVVQKIGTALHHAFLEKIGLTDTVPIELPERGHPQVPNPWRDISSMTIAFGHGMAVTPLHLVHSFNAIVNGGNLIPVTILKQNGEPKEKKRVISEETSQTMRRLLRLVVLEGTGTKAEAPGYVIGGKTGTTEKNKNGHYEKKSLISSFISAFPINDPKYVVLVMVDEPKGQKDSYGFATAGWVAAPAVKEIVERAAPILGVEPQNEDDPKLKEQLAVPEEWVKHENKPGSNKPIMGGDR